MYFTLDKILQGIRRRIRTVSGFTVKAVKLHAGKFMTNSRTVERTPIHVIIHFLDVMQDWVRLKNKGSKDSILNRAKSSLAVENGEVETPLFQSSPPEIFNGPETVPGVPPEMTALLFHGILTKEECSALIEAVPTEGVGFMGPDQVKMLYRGRVVSRFVAFDEPLSTLIQTRLQPFIPQTIDNLQLAGVSPEWRFLHYEMNGHQDAHIDGREKRPLPDGEIVESRLTIQLYLNDHGREYSGGEMVFLDNDYNVKYMLQPKAGDCLLFFQESLTQSTDLCLIHEANKVTSGHKFAARTVVEYKLCT